MTPILALKEVVVDYDGLRAVDHVNLKIEQGARHVIIGPNGAGKTSLFGVIGGQIAASKGDVMLFGQNVTRFRPYQRARIGLGRSFQLSQLFPSMTVAENLVSALVGASSRRNIFWRQVTQMRDVSDRLAESIATWKLEPLAAVRVSELPYGQRRILELAVASATGAELLVLDEPTAGLEPSESQAVLDLLMTLPGDTTVVLIEHDMTVAFEVATIMTVMVSGRVLTTGYPDEIRRDSQVLEAYLGEALDAG